MRGYVEGCCICLTLSLTLCASQGLSKEEGHAVEAARDHVVALSSMAATLGVPLDVVLGE